MGYIKGAYNRDFTVMSVMLLNLLIVEYENLCVQFSFSVMHMKRIRGCLVLTISYHIKIV